MMKLPDSENIQKRVHQVGWFFCGMILGLVVFLTQVRPIEAFSIAFPKFPSFPGLLSIPITIPSIKPFPTPRLLRNNPGNPTVTSTPTPSLTLTPSTTPTSTPTLTPTSTPTPSLTSTPTPTPTSTPAPAVNYGVSFQSVNSQYIDVTTGSSLNSLTQHATWEMWIKPGSISDNPGRSILLARWGNGSSRSWQFSLFNIGTDNYIAALFYDPVDPNNLYTQEAFLQYNFTPNTWYHVAWVYDGTGGTNSDRLKLYLNGVLQTIVLNGDPNLKTIVSSLVIPSSESVRIGASALGQYYNGVIDDVKIWNTSRSTQEIFDNYNKELIGSEIGLVGYWKLNEGTGTMANDETSNNNDGTLINSPSWVSGFTP